VKVGVIEGAHIVLRIDTVSTERTHKNQLHVNTDVGITVVPREYCTTIEVFENVAKSQGADVQ